MAREATITQEAVNAAAEQIRATGAKPTARAVREALGSGSMATVLKHLQAWQANQARPIEANIVLPIALQRSLVTFIEQEVATAKALLEADLALAEQANRDLIAESERQAATINELEQEATALRAEVAAANGRVAQLSSDLESSHQTVLSERQAGELARIELTRAKLQLQSLSRCEDEIERLRATSDAERVALVAAERTAAVLNAKLEKTEAQVNDLQARLTRAEGDARGAMAETSRIREQNSSLQASFDAAVRDGNQARDYLRRVEAEASELRGQLLELRTRNNMGAS